jgi:hypothetical protein
LTGMIEYLGVVLGFWKQWRLHESIILNDVCCSFLNCFYKTLISPFV